jgi:hypothetical protein
VAFNAIRDMLNRKPAESAPGRRTNLVGPRIPRHSSGWSAMLKHLRSEEGLRVLDIGPTSPSNINFLTGLGHSIYMADIVAETHRGDWVKPACEDGSPTETDINAFLDQNLEFNGRTFDVVLLWTTLDYLPEAVIEPMVARLHASLNNRGRLLAFFHSKLDQPASIFYRYHVTDGETVEMQESERLPVRQVSTNRKIEKLFSAYESCKFFLAKDNLYEVIVTR